MPNINISLPSVQSLHLTMTFQGQSLSTGTGFIVDSRRGPLLITNRHNATGRNQTTNQPLSPTGGIPDAVTIMHNAPVLGNWHERPEPLLDAQGAPLWIEHPRLGNRADFVALPLTNLNAVQTYPYDLQNPGPQIAVAVSESISVVGFPFGLRGGGSLGIWATGFVATEPDIDYDDLPIFLVDCRTRPGQSGSAVIAHRNGGMVALANGDTAVMGGPVTRFLGIYSGRINQESDLGIVWKASAIKELVDAC